MARVGRYAEARAIYEAIQTDEAGADRALLGLARLALDPANPHKDDRQAAGYLDRLVLDYPQSARVAEAQTRRPPSAVSSDSSARPDGISPRQRGSAGICSASNTE